MKIAKGIITVAIAMSILMSCGMVPPGLLPVQVRPVRYEI